ncbi:hypothetical protein JCM10213_003340 [Rhodosporidiobolus nylandii]
MSDPSDFEILSAPQWVVTAMVGPVMAGYQAQLILFGVFFCLFADYALSGELAQHSKTNRIILWISFLLNFVYTCFVWEETYNAGVSQKRTLDDFYNGTPQWNALPLLSALIAAFSEAYLTFRAVGLFTNRTAKLVFTGAMSVLIALVVMGGCIVFADGMLYAQGADDEDLTIPWNTGVSIWLWSSALADVVLSASLAYNLRKRIAGFSTQTDGLLRKLVHVSVRTASYTAIVSLVGAIVATIWQDDDIKTTEINIAFWTPAAALHGIALFTFSSAGRRHIANRLGSSQSPSKGVGAFSPPGAAATGGGANAIALQSMPRGGLNPLSVRVQHETQVHFDEEKSSVRMEKEGAIDYEV